jgi:surface carbohydrate biosynthesis protein
LELAEISAIAPKVVLTFVDNSSGFNTLSRLYSKAKFLAVQNGFRGIEVENMANYLSATNLFCFGEDTKKRYEGNGCNIGRYIIGGSLKDGLYRERNPGMREHRFDFCWVSQFRPARFASTLPGLAKNSIRLLEFLYKYCLENDKSLAIAGSCKPNALAQEVAFLGDYIDFTRVSFVPNNSLNFSSYYAISQSEVSVTVSSTIGFEALARGEKVIFCNFLSDQYYDVPDIEGDVPWIIKGPDTTYDDFKNKLQEAYRADRRYWREATQEQAQNLVHVSENILPQDILLDEVARGIANRTTA